tara:strand:+ start:1731 stop:2498 length:768 start_codon:yes stop_codon:yes gene_type:complete
MQTSALSLQQILTVARTSNKLKTNFLQVLADHMNLHGADAKSQVASILASRLSETKDDIEQLPIPEDMKKHLQVQLNPFGPFLNFQNLHMNIEQAKSHFLKAESLLGLMNIHLALTGHVVRGSVERTEAENLAQRFRQVAKQIQHEDLPEALKRSLLKRTLKMASILDHYYAFGPDNLQEELEGLVGAMVVSPPPQGSRVAALYKELARLAVAGLVVLTAVDASLGKAISITENAAKLIEYVEDDGSEGAEVQEM